QALKNYIKSKIYVKKINVHDLEIIYKFVIDRTTPCLVTKTYELRGILYMYVNNNQEEKEVIDSEMKRMREMEKSELKSAIEELSMMIQLRPADNKHDGAHVPTRPFLHVCDLVIQVLDKIGPTMAVFRQDICQNVQRLEMLYESDPSKYSNLVEMLKKEVIEGNAKKGPSCSKAFVWLTRSLDFTVALLRRLLKYQGESMEQAVEESYNITLKPRHGWISSIAVKVALKLVPDNKTFTNILMAKNENYDNLEEDMQTFISLLEPVLEDNHSILRFYRLDGLKST
ncbi:GLTP domain-containing protein, partial [Cephalotus follicularis]